jgi:WhiB family transcriptional regulator, redox-sensing transcriptional regulator
MTLICQPAPHETDQHRQGGDPDVLTTWAPEDLVADPTRATTLLSGFDPLDPLSKECPDDVPCRVQDADLWFAETPAELEQAKAMCKDCPARLACLAGALERREPWGVWGGEIFERGVIIARKRPRGRPRKDERREQAA